MKNLKNNLKIDIKFLPDYPVRKLSEVKDCNHKNAQFQGMYSLVGYYHCPDCKSKFAPQEFQSEHLAFSPNKNFIRV